MHAVSSWRLLWISWCALGGGADFPCLFDFFFLRTHTACCKHEATSSLICLSTGTRFWKKHVASSNYHRNKRRVHQHFWLPLNTLRVDQYYLQLMANPSTYATHTELWPQTNRTRSKSEQHSLVSLILHRLLQAHVTYYTATSIMPPFS